MSVFNVSRLQNKNVLITGASVGIGAVSVILISSPELSRDGVPLHAGYCTLVRKGTLIV